MLTCKLISFCFFLTGVLAQVDSGDADAELLDVYHKRKIKKVTPLWAAQPEDKVQFRTRSTFDWDEPTFKGYNYGPVKGSPPWNYGKPQENEKTQQPSGYNPLKETGYKPDSTTESTNNEIHPGVTQPPPGGAQQTFVFQRPKPSKPQQPPNNQLKPGYPQKPIESGSQTGYFPPPSTNPNGLEQIGQPQRPQVGQYPQPGYPQPGYPLLPWGEKPDPNGESQEPESNESPQPGYPSRPGQTPQPGNPQKPGSQQPQQGSQRPQTGYPGPIGSQQPNPQRPFPPELTSEKPQPGYPQQPGYPKPQPGFPSQPQPGFPQKPQPGFPQQPQPGYPQQPGSSKPQPGFPQPGFPSQPQPGFPQQPQPGFPQQPQPGFPQQPQPGFPQQPQPGFPQKPQPGFPQQPQPGYPQQPGPSKPQPGFPQQPQPGFPQKPQPGFPQQPQPGYPQQPGPSKPQPGFPSQPQPGFPQQPQPSFPQKPQPGFPQQPQPGFPQRPQPGYPQQPQPGYPQQPHPAEPGRPQEPQPGYPQRPPDNQIYPGHPFYPQIQPPIVSGEVVPGLNISATEILRKYCKAPRGQFGTERSCSSFVNCWDDIIVEQECGGGLLFNEDKKYCDYPDRVDCMGRPITKPFIPSDGNCQSSFGTFRSTTNCAEFFVCVHGTANRFLCPGGTAYNSDLGICDYPYRVDCNGVPLIPIEETPDELEYQSHYQGYANEDNHLKNLNNFVNSDENNLSDSIVVHAA